MKPTEILALLEVQTRDSMAFVHRIRDEATVSDIVVALRSSPVSATRRLLCYVLNLRAGAEFFAGLPIETKQAIPALIEVLADPDPEVIASSIDALGHIGDPAAGPALWDLYRKEKKGSNLCLLLASALGYCQYVPAIPTLIEALLSSDSFMRREAACGLRALQAQDAIVPLRQVLTWETDPFTRQMMQVTLQELLSPSTDEEKIDQWISLLTTAATAEERESAATALGDMDQRVLAPLLALLQEGQDEARQAVVLVLAWVGEGRDADWLVRIHRSVVQGPLIQALQDPLPGVRAGCAQALSARWGDERSVIPLLAVIQDADVEVRREVILTLSYLKDERSYEPLLAAFLTDDDWMVRAHAAEGLGFWEDNRAVSSLVEALQDEQHTIRRQAAEMLCWLKDVRAIDSLIQALHDDDSEVREWAVEALWQLCTNKGDDLSAKTIEKMRESLTQASQDDNPEVRECSDKILDWLLGGVERKEY